MSDRYCALGFVLWHLGYGFAVGALLICAAWGVGAVARWIGLRSRRRP